MRFLFNYAEKARLWNQAANEFLIENGRAVSLMQFLFDKEKSSLQKILKRACWERRRLCFNYLMSGNARQIYALTLQDDLDCFEQRSVDAFGVVAEQGV